MEKSNVFVRPASKEDFPRVSDMMVSLYQDLGAEEGFMDTMKTTATFEYLFSPQQDLFLEIVEVNGAIAGYALCYAFWYNEMGGKVLQLDELYLLPAYRGHGLAFQYLERLSAKTEYVALMLEVLPENTKAMNLYKRSGFEPKETITLYKSIG
ncbi:MAG: GNAT family N-acetyltransferase [Cytophagales bacterium]|nr:GNAT family N-acetyltransferase [Cytophagales bacterium]